VVSRTSRDVIQSSTFGSVKSGTVRIE
jgi:hypothetical protein